MLVNILNQNWEKMAVLTCTWQNNYNQVIDLSHYCKPNKQHSLSVYCHYQFMRKTMGFF